MLTNWSCGWAAGGLPEDQVRQRTLDLVNRSFDILERGLAQQ